MYGKMQESWLTEIIPLIYILTIYGEYPVFLHSGFPSRCTIELGGSCNSWGLYGWNILCWLKWQVTFFGLHLIPAVFLQSGSLESLASPSTTHSVSSVAQSCLTFCDPMDCSMPGLPVHYQLPEFTQTYVHWVGDAIQPSHPLPTLFSFCLQSFPGYNTC